MTRCGSQYQNRNMEAEPLGPPIRCTRSEGHPDGEATPGDDMHRNFRPGHKIKWPESAAMKVESA